MGYRTPGELEVKADAELLSTVVMSSLGKRTADGARVFRANNGQVVGATWRLKGHLLHGVRSIGGRTTIGDEQVPSSVHRNPAQAAEP